ncbi:C40 family peptidase [Orrella sp. JC864]|uniref:C40 family peptidase n=1 Tax=Orrella sp. JC864 TaxID=3120298 RepID=UPI0012BB7F38
MTPPQRLFAVSSRLASCARPLAALVLAAAACGAHAKSLAPQPAPILASLSQEIDDSELLSGAQAPAVLHAWLRDDESVPLRERLVSASLAELGVRYAWGGDDPQRGFDCSGLVRFVYASIAAIDLPHRARQQRPLGRPVQRKHLQPGDLVFFNTMRHPASHVGIYIGNGEFVHAPSRGARVRVDKLSNSYWAKRYTGARRYLDKDAASRA